MAQVERATSSGGKQYLTQVISNLQTESSNVGWATSDSIDERTGFYFLGFNTDISDNWGNRLEIRAFVPENFVIEEAVITFLHIPVYWDNGGDYALWGHCQNMKLYSVSNKDDITILAWYAGEYYRDEALTLTEIPGVFGASGYTSPDPDVGVANQVLSTTKSLNIKDYLTAGDNFLVIKTSTAVPSVAVDPIDNFELLAQYSGYAKAVLNITGYRG